MLDSIEVNANLHSQLIQRELDGHLQRNPHIFAAHLYRERFRIAKNLYKYDLRAHYGCVNAIEFSNGGKYLASGGDDKRVLIWDIEMSIAGLSRPRILDTEHTSNIFCLGFDRPNRKVLSGGNDDLVIVHDFETGKLDNVYKHDNPVYGLSIDPQCDSVFATACEDGQILVFDQRSDPSDPLVVAQLRTSFHAVEFHPTGGNYLVTANSKRGAAFWDIRKPHHPVIQYGYLEDPPSCMSVRFNSTGSLILALRRRLPPILYNTQSAEPVCTFYHGNYYNSCTMKSCSFAGEDDEFVLSGSDDFNLYVWRVSDVDMERTDQWVETTQMVLYGHRSIVNQVRYNREKCLLASSGVEKIIKLWSPFEQKGWTGSLLEEATAPENPRELYSPYNFPAMSTPPHSWSHMSHDYSSRNTNEDPRMMAFFDSLIQQEIEGWDTNSSTDSPIETEGSYTNSSSNDSSSDSSLDDDDDDDDAGDETGARTERRPKRNVARRKERKHVKSTMGKLKIQRHKYTNRIAYLIATKRNTLRRLAIKGASLSNRGLHKIVKVGGPNRKSTGTAKTARSFVSKRRARRQSTVRSNAATASTSAGAASSSGYRSQRRKHKKQRTYDSSSDEDAEVGNPIASGSSRYNSVAYASNMPVPSTSTGITSSLKDDIIRLRQQQQQQSIDDSDEDDDDYQPRTLNRLAHQPTEIVVDPTVQPTKKLNGVRRANDAAVMGRSSSGAPSVNTPLTRSGSSALLQRTAAQVQHHQQQSQHIPPLRSTSIVTAAEANDRYIEVDTSRRSPGLSTSFPMRRSTETATTPTSPLLPQSSNNIINTTTTTTNRRRPHVDLLDQYSSHSNSRLSNSSYQDEILEDSASSSSGSSCAASAKLPTDAVLATTTQHSKPFKRRKIALTEYINVHSNIATNEVNNNEQNNMFAASGSDNNSSTTDYHQHQQQQQQPYNNNHTTEPTDNNNVADANKNEANQFVVGSSSGTSTSDHPLVDSSNYYNSNQPNGNSSISSSNSNSNDFATTSAGNLLQTPDSGISVATMTPSYSRHTNDSSSSVVSGYCNGNENIVAASTTSQQQLLSPCNENAKSNKVSINLFHQKVARVRRNYRKKFADESESD